MDKVDLEILYSAAKADCENTTYGLATQTIDSLPKNSNGRSHSAGNLDSTYRYHCNKLHRLGLLEKTVVAKGKNQVTLFSLSPQGVCVSDGSLVILSDKLITTYGCTYTTRCSRCQPPPDNKSPIVFRPIRVHHAKDGGEVTYSAPECLFLKEIFGCEGMPELEDIRRQVIKILDAKYAPLPVTEQAVSEQIKVASHTS